MSSETVVSPWLTSQEAAAYLKISIQVLHREVHAGAIKASRVGNYFRIHKNDLDQFFNRRRGTIRPYRKGSKPWVSARWKAYRSAKKVSRG